jgi:hypothetical protein
MKSGAWFFQDSLYLQALLAFAGVAVLFWKKQMGLADSQFYAIPSVGCVVTIVRMRTSRNIIIHTPFFNKDQIKWKKNE